MNRITLDRVRRAAREHRFVVALALTVGAFLIITQQVLMGGPVVSLDYWVHNQRIDLRHPGLFDTMYYLVMMGQRAPSAKLAYVIVCILAWRRRSWRPLLVLSLSLFALNGFVGVLKLLTSRLRPADGSAAVFTHIGDIYPSGHASNVVVTWGIVAYVLVRYGPLRTYRPGIVITSVATFIVGIASIYLDTHWVSDILAGWLAGALILLVSVKIDLEYQSLRDTANRRLRAITEVGALVDGGFASDHGFAADHSLSADHGLAADHSLSADHGFAADHGPMDRVGAVAPGQSAAAPAHAAVSAAASAARASPAASPSAGALTAAGERPGDGSGAGDRRPPADHRVPA